MKKLLSSVFVLMLAFCLPAMAQEFEVPANYSLVAKEDYAPYEKDVIAASKWLQAVPANEQVQKRKEVSAFVVKWINGSPTVNVNLYGVMADISKKNPPLLVIYMAAAAQYCLETGDYKNKRPQEAFAVNAMLKYYQLGNGLSREKKMDKLQKMEEDGKLSEWLDQNFK